MYVLIFSKCIWYAESLAKLFRQDKLKTWLDRTCSSSKLKIVLLWLFIFQKFFSITWITFWQSRSEQFSTVRKWNWYGHWLLCIYSDVLRVAILYKFGGTYMDTDIITLSDHPSVRVIHKRCLIMFLTPFSVLPEREIREMF